MFDEIFKECPYNNYLLVSQYGRIKNKSTDEILKQTIFKGYLIVEDPSNNRAFEWVHRLVALAWITDVPDYGRIIQHKNNNGFDNRMDNLKWINENSVKERKMDRKIEDMNELFQKGWSTEEIAKAFNVEKEYIEENIIQIPKTIPHIIRYTFDELAQMVEEPPYEYVNLFNGIPVHQILDIDLLPGEVFRKYPENELIEVSNLGRIKIDNKIIEQWDDDEKGKDYLCVKIGHIIDYPKYVYRFVAETWCKKPYEPNNSTKWHVHHISNNGYDNRPANLLWVKENEHLNKIHK
jgi:hypothetical protein